MSSDWYLKIDNVEHGPLSSETLKSLAQRGKVTPKTPLRKGASGTWVSARHVKGLFPAATGQVERATVASQSKSGSPPPISSPITDDEIVDLVKSASSDLPPLASSVGLLPASPAPTAVPPCIPPTTFQEAIEKRQDSKRTVTPKRIAIGGVSGLAVLLVVVVALSHFGRPVEREQKQAGNRQDTVAAGSTKPNFDPKFKNAVLAFKKEAEAACRLLDTRPSFSSYAKCLDAAEEAFARIPLPSEEQGIYERREEQGIYQGSKNTIERLKFIGACLQKRSEAKGDEPAEKLLTLAQKAATEELDHLSILRGVFESQEEQRQADQDGATQGGVPKADTNVDADVETWFREAERQRTELLAEYREALRLHYYGITPKDIEDLEKPGSRPCELMGPTVGALGVIDKPAIIEQRIDTHSAIATITVPDGLPPKYYPGIVHDVRYATKEQSVMLRGLDLSETVDGEPFKFMDFMKVTGTTTYNTALGGTRTVCVLEPLSLATQKRIADLILRH